MPRSRRSTARTGRFCAQKAAFVLEMLDLFPRLFPGDAPVLLVRSAGRINLIGMHVDHRGGVVNPIAVRETWCLCRPRQDDLLDCATPHERLFPRRKFSHSAGTGNGEDRGLGPLDAGAGRGTQGRRHRGRLDQLHQVRGALPRTHPADSSRSADDSAARGGHAHRGHSAARRRSQLVLLGRRRRRGGVDPYQPPADPRPGAGGNLRPGGMVRRHARRLRRPRRDQVREVRPRVRTSARIR